MVRAHLISLVSAALPLNSFPHLRMDPIRRSLATSLLLFCFLLVPVLSAPIRSPFGPEIAFFYRTSVECAWHLILFYVTNFIAHTASVPLTVEIEGPTQYRSLSRGQFPWAALISLFLPFRALGRDILLIAQTRKDSVESALAHGTLLVLARNEEWKPPMDREDQVFIKLPEHYESLPQDSNLPSAALTLLKDEGYVKIKGHERLVHGEISIPDGYTLAAPKYISKSTIYSTLKSTRKVYIHRPPEYLKILVSLVQMISAAFTLASTLDNQRSRYGYAAYGLSVFPYALMSLANAI